MAKPYDAAVKDLIQKYPADWMARIGVRGRKDVEVIEADLSTVTAQADKVILVRDRKPWILHLELQSGRDPDFGRRMLKYNALLHERHALPVHGAVILLRREADGLEMKGRVEYSGFEDESRLSFSFQVIRLWQIPPGDILEGGLGTLPLAPLANVARKDLPGVIGRMDERFADEAPADAPTLWTSALVLMGLRYDKGLSHNLLKGVRNMRESTTYQEILAEGRGEGRVEEARRIVLLLGTTRLGKPSTRAKARLSKIGNHEELERISTRLLEVASWDDLLGDA